MKTLHRVPCFRMEDIQLCMSPVEESQHCLTTWSCGRKVFWANQETQAVTMCDGVGTSKPTYTGISRCVQLVTKTDPE